MATTPLGTTSKWPMLEIPTFQAGKIPAAPSPSSYFAPLPDTGRIQFLTQQAAAPGARKLRMGLLGALQASKRAENPNVQALLGRQAVAGYGEGLESVMGGARREGMGMYAPEYAAMTEQEKANWLAANEKERSDYLAVLEQYKAKLPVGMARPTSVSGEERMGLSDFGLSNDTDRIYQANKASMLGGGYPTSSGVDNTAAIALNRFIENNPNATRGDVDAYKLKIGMETGQSASYDQYLRENYMPHPETDYNSFLSAIPSYGG